MFKFLLRCLVWIDNCTYKLITKLAISRNHGVHPKHALMNYHQFFIDHIDEGDTVLDIGCNTGEIAYEVAHKAKNVFGIDINEKHIAYAQKHFKKDNLVFVTGDVLSYHFNDTFDKIIFSNVLEHIEDRISFLKKLRELSNIILLRVPMLNRDWLTVYKKEQGLEYQLDPTHYIEYTLPVLRDELSQAGWYIKNYSIQFGEFWGVLTTQ